MPKLFGQVTPRRAGAGDPEHTVQNQAVIHWLAPVWLPDSLDEWLEERPLSVRHQISRQDSLPSESYLESRQCQIVNPFCQHDLGGITTFLVTLSFMFTAPGVIATQVGPLALSIEIGLFLLKDTALLAASVFFVKEATDKILGDQAFGA